MSLIIFISIYSKIERKDSNLLLIKTIVILFPQVLSKGNFNLDLMLALFEGMWVNVCVCVCVRACLWVTLFVCMHYLVFSF